MFLACKDAPHTSEIPIFVTFADVETGRTPSLRAEYTYFHALYGRDLSRPTCIAPIQKCRELFVLGIFIQFGY